MNIVDKFVTYLTPGHFEGIVLYLISVAILTGVHIRFVKDFTAGLKGANGLWEGTEILLYVCLWIIPAMVFADIFLQLHASEIVWYSMIAFTLLGVLGRWGLEWLLAFKSGASSVTSTTTVVEKKTETQTEQK